ncbi:MAG: protein kinase [Polyangiaceae bacterium]|nr:protein kinase [Polyangiaceae bacterium]
MPAPVSEGQWLAGKYRVDQVLGEGGMGVVVAATDTQLERRVAIKFLLPEYVTHPEAAERFLREARAAAKIRSEHVARVIDVGTLETGAPYMVMEYLEGSDLAAVMGSPAGLLVEEATGYVLQACEAVAEAHARGIIHRDLKPANLFLSVEPGGTRKVKVLDFGISKTIIGGKPFAPSLTKTAALMGSPLYMSPEQMRSTRNVDARTDIWALGVILYELLAHEPPFQGESITELSAKVLLDSPAPIRSVRPDVPEGLEQVVFKALAKNPEERYPSIAEFAVALAPFAPRRERGVVENITRILQAAGLSTSALDVPPSLPAGHRGAQTVGAWGGTQGPAQPRKAARWPWVLAASVSVLVVGSLVGAIALGSRPSPGAHAPTPGPEVAPGAAPRAAQRTPSTSVAATARSGAAEPPAVAASPAAESPRPNAAATNTGKASGKPAAAALASTTTARAQSGHASAPTSTRPGDTTGSPAVANPETGASKPAATKVVSPKPAVSKRRDSGAAPLPEFGKRK